MNVILTTSAQLSTIQFDDAALFLIPVGALALAISKKMYSDWANKNEVRVEVTE